MQDQHSRESNQTTSGYSTSRSIATPLSFAALTLSTFSLLGSGVMLYQLSAVRQELKTFKSASSALPASPNQLESPLAKSMPSPAQTANLSSISFSSPTSSDLTVATQPSQASATASIKPGQFVRPAFRHKANVELLRVNRIPGERNAVNVQFRVRLLTPEEAFGSNVITPTGMSARNPVTSETYGVYQQKGSSPVSLFTMRLDNQSSADAYAWLQVPEGVNTINIYIPDTQEFLNVPIAPS